MCDIPEEEFAEYLRWVEATTASHARSTARSRRPRDENEVVTPLPAEITA